jgi:hypothetical protein
MKKILLILSLFPILVFSQKSYKIPADSTILNNIGSGKNELVIRNATSNITGGVLTNLGNGVTAFVLGGGSARVVDTIYKNSAKDSIVFTISGIRYAVKDSIGVTDLSGYALQSSLNDTASTLRRIRKVDSSYLFKNATRDSICMVTVINGSTYRTCAFDSSNVNTDSQSLHLAFDDSITLSITRGNYIKFAYAVDSVGLNAGGDSIVVIKAGLRKGYAIGSSGSGASLSGLTAATATNNIQNTNYKQRWNWNTLAGDTAMVIASNSKGAASNLQNLLTISQSGANATSSQTTYGLKVSNLKTGTLATNIGAYFEALSGATNYSAEFLGDIKINAYSNIRMGVGSQILMTSGSACNFNSTTQGIKYNLIGYMDYFGGSVSHIFTSTKTLPFVIAATASTNYLSFAKPSTNQNSIIFNGDFESGSYRGETTFSNTINTANGILKIAANTGQTGGYAAFTPNYVLTIKPTTCINLKPITATAASAITAAEGDMVFVSDTNGTFTSIGLWCYENGVWSKK